MVGLGDQPHESCPSIANLHRASHCSYGSAVAEGAGQDSLSSAPMQMRATVYGIVMLLVSVSVSSFAAVFTEYTLKRNLSVSGLT